MSEGLPHDEHLEQVLLGTLLSGGDVAAVAEVIQATAFLLPSHRDIFGALVAADQSDDRRMSPAAINRRMREAGTAVDKKTLNQLTALAQKADPRGTEVGHARALAKIARRRAAVVGMRESIDRILQDPGAEPAVILAARMADLETDAPTGKGWTSHDDLIMRHLATIEARRSQPEVCPGAPTGIPELDLLTGGLQKGKSILVGGRPKMGKSAVVEKWALHAASKGHGVGIIHLEMTEEEHAERAFAMDARVHSNDLRSGDIRPDAWRRLLESAERLAGLPIWIDDTPTASISQIIGKVRRLKARHPEVGVIVLDYLQLAKAEGPNGQSRQQEIGRISRGVKLTAKEQEVCFVSVAQLSRKCEDRQDKRPMPSDLREAGDLEQDADTIIFCYRHEVYEEDTADKGIMELIVAANRGGGTGTVKVKWTGAEYRHDPLSTPAQEQAYTYDGRYGD